MPRAPYRAVHFVGFTDTRQYWQAVQVFGEPDFIHVRWDVRVMGGGEFDSENDTVVFARGTEQDEPSPWAWNDSERM